MPQGTFYQCNWQKWVMIWFSINPDVFLSPQNKERTKHFLSENPSVTLTFIHGLHLLSNEKGKKDFDVFSRELIAEFPGRIHFLDFFSRDFIENLRGERERLLYEIAEQELRALRYGGNPASASDIVRVLCPSYMHGVYKDFDVCVTGINANSTGCDTTGLLLSPCSNDVVFIPYAQDMLETDKPMKQLKVVQEYILDKYGNFLNCTFHDTWLRSCYIQDADNRLTKEPMNSETRMYVNYFSQFIKHAFTQKESRGSVDIRDLFYFRKLVSLFPNNPYRKYFEMFLVVRTSGPDAYLPLKATPELSADKITLRDPDKKHVAPLILNQDLRFGVTDSHLTEKEKQAIQRYYPEDNDLSWVSPQDRNNLYASSFNFKKLRDAMLSSGRCLTIGLSKQIAAENNDFIRNCVNNSLPLLLLNCGVHVELALQNAQLRPQLLTDMQFQLKKLQSHKELSTVLHEKAHFVLNVFVTYCEAINIDNFDHLIRMVPIFNEKFSDGEAKLVAVLRYAPEFLVHLMMLGDKNQGLSDSIVKALFPNLEFVLVKKLFLACPEIFNTYLEYTGRSNTVCRFFQELLSCKNNKTDDALLCWNARERPSYLNVLMCYAERECNNSEAALSSNSNVPQMDVLLSTLAGLSASSSRQQLENKLQQKAGVPTPAFFGKGNDKGGAAAPARAAEVSNKSFTKLKLTNKKSDSEIVSEYTAADFDAFQELIVGEYGNANRSRLELISEAGQMNSRFLKDFLTPEIIRKFLQTPSISVNDISNQWLCEQLVDRYYPTDPKKSSRFNKQSCCSCSPASNGMTFSSLLPQFILNSAVEIPQA